VGTLYLVSTPIGNLEDLTERARRVLGEVDAVLAEDTRRTRRLLIHIGVSTRVVSLHAHNERQRLPRILERLRNGASLALVSDAGTPLVSDPGARLVDEALGDGHTVVPLPGPSAVLSALVVSGFPTVPFTFFGFLPRKGRERGELLDRVAASRETVVLFESPERVGDLLVELAGRADPERRAVVAREITKLHEEFRRGTLAELARYYVNGKPPRGEVTVVVSPSGTAPDSGAEEAAGRALARSLLEGGASPRSVAREVSSRLGIPRNRAYDLVQTLRSPGS
jgi:16S rRNA (cytidine1402-2'-O)-methyltransferase